MIDNNQYKLTTSKKASLELAHRIASDGRMAVIPTKAIPTAEDSTAFTPKIPAVKNWGNRASTDPAEIDAMWEKLNENGIYGVGIPCKPSNLVVLDIDTPEHSKDGKTDGMASLKKLEERLGALPETYTVRTGTGGLHLYFNGRDGVIIPSSASVLGPGIDVKTGTNADGRPEGNGGQVVAPGNVFKAPDGTIRCYELIKDLPIADLPQAWIDALKAGNGPQNRQAAQEASRTGTTITMPPDSKLEKWSRQAIACMLEELAQTPQGERNNTLNNVALRSIRIAMNGSIRGQGSWLKQELTQAAQQAGLSMQEITKTIQSAAKKAEAEGPAYPKDYSPAQAQPLANNRTTAQTAQTAPQQPQEWPEPIEYGTTGEKLSIDPLMDDMPPVIRDFCAGLAASVQVPQELCLAMMLPAIATCVQGKVKVQVKPGYCEPVNIYTLCPLPPANRKSSVVGICLEPLLDWETKKEKEMASDIKFAELKLEGAKQRIDELMKAARKESYVTEEGRRKRAEYDAEIKEITDNMPEVPTIPRLLVDDTTPEKMASIMCEQGGKIGLITAEPGIFDTLSGMYSSNGVANIQPFLKGWTGHESYRVDRLSREKVILSNPLVSMGITPQPGMMKIRKSAERFRHSGMDARFLYFMPDSLLGSRTPDSPEMPKEAKNAYHALIRALLDMPYADEGEPHVLELSPEAGAIWREFFNEIEPRLKEGGEFEDMSDWGGKICGASVRLAGLFHIAATRGDLTQKEISGQTMQTAVNLSRLLCQHAIIAYELLGGNEQGQGGQRILEWIQKGKITEFSARDCQQRFRNTAGLKDKSTREAALRDLEERFYIREAPQVPVVGRGRKPALKYQVNPAIYAPRKTAGD